MAGDGVSKQVLVGNELGIHARSAAGIAKLAKKAKSGIWLEKDGDRADAKSVIDILTLACLKGSQITIGVDDSSDAHVLEEIVNLVKNNFGE